MPLNGPFNGLLDMGRYANKLDPVVKFFNRDPVQQVQKKRVGKRR